MRYNRLGQTGVKVSALGLGTATWGAAPAGARSTIAGRALDVGINLVDTANSYGNQPRFDRGARPGAPAPRRRTDRANLGGDAMRSCSARRSWNR